MAALLLNLGWTQTLVRTRSQDDDDDDDGDDDDDDDDDDGVVREDVKLWITPF